LPDINFVFSRMQILNGRCVIHLRAYDQYSKRIQFMYSVIVYFKPLSFSSPTCFGKQPCHHQGALLQIAQDVHYIGIIKW
jgi:hypothetical protein